MANGSPAPTMNFETWADIRTDILDRAEEETGVSVSEFYAFVARAADRGYHDFLNRRPWLCARARRPLVLRLYAPINATITWNQNAYTAVLGAVQAVNLVGWKVLHPTLAYGIRIVTHVPGSAAIGLEAVNLGANLAASAVVLYRDEYDLAAIQDTPSAPVGALAGLGVGLVDNGAHTYGVAFYNHNGETPAGATVAVVVVNKAADGQVNLTNVPLGPPGTVGRRIYRSTAGLTTPLYLLADIADNLTTTFLDNLADATISVLARSADQNTTAGLRHVVGMWVQGNSNRQVHGPWTEERIREEYPGPPKPTWPPTCYARISETQVRFSHYASQDGFLEIPHTYIPKDLSTTVGASEIVVPRNWRYVLSDFGLWHLLDMKHDDRAVKWFQQAEKDVNAYGKDEEVKRIGDEGTRDRVRKEPAY